MELMIEYARSESLSSVRGQVLQENTTMLRMCRNLGFAVTTDPQDASIADVILRLNP
jgi:acetyltransferase